MIDGEDDAHRPLPVVLRPVEDELLSSWLARHAAYYGVTGPFFAKWLMLGTRKPLGSRPSAAIGAGRAPIRKAPTRSDCAHSDDVHRCAGGIRLA